MSLFYWLMLGLSLSVNVLFFISILFREKRARDEKDAVVRHYDGLLVTLSIAEKRGLDRLRALLDDVEKMAEENADLAKVFDEKALDLASEHHSGKAAALRELLARHRGW